MRKLWNSVIITTIVWFIFQMSPFLGSTAGLIMFLMGITTILMIWMVITILKTPNPSSKRFEGFFYEDSDYQRNN